ncbi:helix-turn-helix domain-containing protein [Candidatus Uabimicrobium sp. HlEnr_7]|uniref:helix-turn-helix domain-containing protein n=1 Tax=Candidatus Uabimicrobium helgolandensis TaxID=3095367 RepID=UPI003559057F
MEKINIGKIIREGRINQNISQRQLANEYNVTPAAISAWERNKTSPPAHVLILLAKKLDIVEELFGYPKPKKEDENQKIWNAINEIREKIGLV